MNTSTPLLAIIDLKKTIAQKLVKSRRLDINEMC